MRYTTKFHKLIHIVNVAITREQLKIIKKSKNVLRKSQNGPDAINEKNSRSSRPTEKKLGH